MFVFIPHFVMLYDHSTCESLAVHFLAPVDNSRLKETGGKTSYPPPHPPQGAEILIWNLPNTNQGRANANTIDQRFLIYVIQKLVSSIITGDRCLQMAAVAAVGGTNVLVGIASSAFTEAVVYPAHSMKQRCYGISQGLYCITEDRWGRLGVELTDFCRSTTTDIPLLNEFVSYLRKTGSRRLEL